MMVLITILRWKNLLLCYDVMKFYVILHRKADVAQLAERKLPKL